MTKDSTFILLFIAAAFFIGQGCNPDCNSASTQNIAIDPGTSAIQAGRTNQILLRSQPSNFIIGRKIFMDDPEKAAPSRVELKEKEFAEELNGVIVTIPEDLSNISTPAIYVDDPDCSSEVILVNSLPIRDQEFFFFSDFFVVPPMPLIIIPTAPVLPPVNITNAWITPYERSYCIWFVPEMENGVEQSELRPYVPEIEDPLKERDPSYMLGSHEFVVCGTNRANSNADKNPVTGIVDKDSGVIQIKIDRTAKGLGVEVFTGMFIEDTQIPDTDEWRNGGGCAVGAKTQSDFMLLTSESTGQQILMIKAS